MHINNAVCILEIYQVNGVYHPHLLTSVHLLSAQQDDLFWKEKKTQKD